MFLKSEKLNCFPEIIHGFTTRELGADYARIATVLGISDQDFFTLKQVHSDQVYFLQDRSIKSDRSNRTYEGDAIVTQARSAVIAIRTADCVPILVYDSEHQVVAAIHAGWKGLVKGIIENTIRSMQTHFKTDPKMFQAALGPALCSACFEIGPEVVEAFQKKFSDRIPIIPGHGDRSHLDLRKGCELALCESGLNIANLEFLPYCTSCRTDLLFSFRKGDKNERILGFIGIR